MKLLLWLGCMLNIFFTSPLCALDKGTNKNTQDVGSQDVKSQGIPKLKKRKREEAWALMENKPRIDLYQKLQKQLNNNQIILFLDDLNKRFTYTFFSNQEKTFFKATIKCRDCSNLVFNHEGKGLCLVKQYIKRSILNHLLKAHLKKEFIEAGCKQNPEKSKAIKKIFSDFYCPWCEKNFKYLSRICEHLNVHVRFVNDKDESQTENTNQDPLAPLYSFRNIYATLEV